MAQFMFILKDSRYDDTREDFLKFVDYIVDTADGVILWARLVVRSLVSGITHSDSPADLHARLEHTPKDLNGLFRKMLAGIDDAVRDRSNKMLLVAIHNPFDTPLNALAYSWLNDLGDPKFPFNQPIWFYSGEEVTKRISLVRHQIDVLTKGLLGLLEQNTNLRILIDYGTLSGVCMGLFQRLFSCLGRLRIDTTKGLTLAVNHTYHFEQKPSNGDSLKLLKTWATMLDFSHWLLASTEDQLQKLENYVGELTGSSFFMATYCMYFPFLSCEVKYGATVPDIADRQNAHNMTMAVRGYGRSNL
jgi:hypothetical protein